MKKILLESDTIVIDSVELSYGQLKTLLLEEVASERKRNFVRTTFNGGVSK